MKFNEHIFTKDIEETKDSFRNLNPLRKNLIDNTGENTEKLKNEYSADANDPSLLLYVWLIIRYMSGTWAISKNVEQKINAFQGWYYRKMLRISWAENKTITVMLRRTGLKHPILWKF